MTVRLIGESENEFERRFVEVMNGTPIISEMPAPDYVVMYGCGQGVIIRPDGSTVPYEGHLPGCEHEEMIRS